MRKILFMIDDDQDDREIFQEAIINCNASVELVFAEDGEQALKLLASGKTQPDVIFLDYNMPRMSGIECLKKLKSNEKTKNIPTIMYTTSGDREQEKVLLLLGADYYMRKTTSFMELCKELQRLLAIVDTDPGKLKSLIPRTEL
jgi:CheY-like chemotaxis protein